MGGRQQGRDRALDARDARRGEGARRQDLPEREGRHPGRDEGHAPHARRRRPRQVPPPRRDARVLRLQADDDRPRRRPRRGLVHRAARPGARQEGASYLATSADPNGPPDPRSTFDGAALQARFLDKAPELYGKVQTVVVDDKAPKLGLDGTVDMVLAHARAARHGEQRRRSTPWLAEIQQGAQAGRHPRRRGAPRQARTRTRTRARRRATCPEKWVIEHVEAAGFKLAGKSEINANPKDTKDYAGGRVDAAADASRSRTRTTTSTPPSARATG